MKGMVLAVDREFPEVLPVVSAGGRLFEGRLSGYDQSEIFRVYTVRSADGSVEFDIPLTAREARDCAALVKVLEQNLCYARCSGN